MRHPRVLIVAVALGVVASAAATAVVVRPEHKSQPVVAGPARSHVRSDDSPDTTVALDLGGTSGSTTTTGAVPRTAKRTTSSTTPHNETTTASAPSAPSAPRCTTPGANRLAFIDVQRSNEPQVGYALSILDLSTHASKVVAVNSDFYPSWSADGCELVTDVQGRVTRFGIDGATTVVSPEGSQDRWASVSPDGRSIAFVTAHALWVMDASGSNRRHLADLGTANYLPSWSPENSTIAYEAEDANGGYQVFTIKPDGSAKRQLTNGPGSIEFPTWSPDGSQIGFTQGGAPQTMGIFTIQPDGSSPQKRADYSTDWRWSADGARIVSSQPVQSNNGGQVTFNVTVTTLATGAEQAFPEGYNASGVTFTPSANAVVFEGLCEGHDNSLCRLDLGSGATTLLVDYAGSGRPVFAPR